MTIDEPTRSIRSELRAAITAALKTGDRARLATYRSALAAIDNAESVPPEGNAGPIESSAVGVAATEARRAVLTEQDMLGIVVADATDRRAAAELVRAADPARAEQLRRQADLLDAMVAAAHRAEPTV